MELKTNKEFKDICPPLTEVRYNLLEKSILNEGCRDNLIVWGDTIIDGHNRYEICKKHGIDFDITKYEFADKEEAKIWIIDNQNGRRNITDGWKYELAQIKKTILLDKHEKERKKHRVSNIDTRDKKSESGRTRQEIAKDLDWSTGKVAMADKVWKEAEPEVKDKIKDGEISINQAYKKVKRDERKKKNEEKVQKLKEKEVAPPTGKYDVIVIDPPWEMEKIEREVAPNQVGFDYPTMTIDEIKDIDLPAEENAHIFLWITQKYLPYGFEVLKSWGVKYILSFVWHKNGGFQPFGLPQYNCEFVLYGRIGSPKFIDLKKFNTCFNADRTGHSKKPIEFYDMIKRVTAGNKIDMFNRKPIDGFDSWGNE